MRSRKTRGRATGSNSCSSWLIIRKIWGKAKFAYSFLKLVAVFYFIYFLNFYFILGYSQLIILGQFQVNSKGTQPCIYMPMVLPVCPQASSCVLNTDLKFINSESYLLKLRGNRSDFPV